MRSSEFERYKEPDSSIWARNEDEKRDLILFKERYFNSTGISIEALVGLAKKIVKNTPLKTFSNKDKKIYRKYLRKYQELLKERDKAFRRYVLENGNWDDVKRTIIDSDKAYLQLEEIEKKHGRHPYERNYTSRKSGKRS